jgi:hypothetical protein
MAHLRHFHRIPDTLFHVIPSSLTLCLREGIRETLHVALELTMVLEELNIGTIHLDTSGSLGIQVLLTTERSETPVLGDDDLLPAGELVLGATESLESDSTVYDS